MSHVSREASSTETFPKEVHHIELAGLPAPRARTMPMYRIHHFCFTMTQQMCPKVFSHRTVIIDVQEMFYRTAFHSGLLNHNARSTLNVSKLYFVHSALLVLLQKYASAAQQNLSVGRHLKALTAKSITWNTVTFQDHPVLQVPCMLVFIFLRYAAYS